MAIIEQKYHVGPQEPELVYAYKGQIEALQAEIDRLREGIQIFLDGDYQPLPAMACCAHGRLGFQPCEDCADEHFERLLKRTLEQEGAGK